MPISVTKNTHRQCFEKSKKIVAFIQLTQEEGTCSHREAAELLRIPKSTLQDWQRASNDNKEQLELFFSTPAGAQLLNRIVVAAHFVIQFRGKGCRSTGEFIELSGLGRWVAHSHGALHSFSKRVENSLCEIGSEQRDRLATDMKQRKIILCEDETFHQGKPCLVAIDALSNYILLEEYSNQRSAEDWDRAVNQALGGLNVEIVSSTSDEGTAILAHVKKTLQVEHSPDLFHVQQEISKATSAPLRSQAKKFEKERETARKRLSKSEEKHGKESFEACERRRECRLKEYGYELREKRCARVRSANKGIGEDYHPVNLQSGTLWSPEEVKASLESRLDAVEASVCEACLQGSSLRRVKKARRMIEPLHKYLTFFFFLLNKFIESLELQTHESDIFKTTLFPLAYLERIMKTMNKKRQEQLQPIIAALWEKVRDGPVQGRRLEWLRIKANEIAHLFQRSSSCVEGRNGVLSMMHHGFHGLKEQRLKALTTIHNYHVLRPDGSTAAKRFFGKEHDRLFDELLYRVKIPEKPRGKWKADRKGVKPRRLVA